MITVVERVLFTPFECTVQGEDFLADSNIDTCPYCHTSLEPIDHLEILNSRDVDLTLEKAQEKYPHLSIYDCDGKQLQIEKN